MTFSKLYLLSSLAIILMGCGPSKEAESAKAPVANAAEAESPRPSAAESAASPAPIKVGDTAKCPVSGEEFTVAEGSPKVTYEGRDYYFCCPTCADRFNADPKKYAK